MRYKVYASVGAKQLAKLIQLGLEDTSPRPKFFDSLEEADEYAFVQRLTGYKVTIQDTQKKPTVDDLKVLKILEEIKRRSK